MARRSKLGHCPLHFLLAGVHGGRARARASGYRASLPRPGRVRGAEAGPQGLPAPSTHPDKGNQLDPGTGACRSDPDDSAHADTAGF